MKEQRNLSKLLLKKTTGLFKVSLLFFFFSMVLVILGGCLFIREYENVNNQFIKNENTHMIKINYKLDKYNQIEMLKFQDEDNIHQILEEEYADCYNVYPVYQVECGISSETDEMYYIKAIDPKTISMLGIYEKEENVIYQNTTEKDNITLHIPKIRVSEDGCEAYDSFDKKYKMKVIQNENNAYDLYNDRHLENSYMSYNDFKQVVEQMYDEDWKQIQDNYDNGINYGMNMIESYYVYADNISDVKSIAQKLEKENYCVQYTMKAFQNLDKTVRLIMCSAILFLAVIVIISTVATIISFRNYYKLQQRDMGILKQMGYSQKTIWGIYSQGLNWIFGIILIGVFIVGCFTGVLLLKITNFVALGSVVAGVIILMLIIWGIISNILYRYTKKDILTLLKLSKETE